MKSTWLNLVFICLNDDFGKSVSARLAKQLDMFFADCKDIVEYDLIDSQAIFDNCGIEYLKKREFDAIKRCANFNNTIISIDFDLFKANRAAFNNENVLCYIGLPETALSEKDNLNRISYLNREKYLKKECPFIIELENKNLSNAIFKIKQKLGEWL